MSWGAGAKIARRLARQIRNGLGLGGTLSGLLGLPRS